MSGKNSIDVVNDAEADDSDDDDGERESCKGAPILWTLTMAATVLIH